MRISASFITVLLLATAIATLSGCGRKGKLYEPDYGRPQLDQQDRN